MKAALLPHLERFEDASAILSGIDDPEYRAPVDYLLSLCRRRDPLSKSSFSLEILNLPRMTGPSDRRTASLRIAEPNRLR